MVGVERVFAHINDCFVQIHTVGTQLVQSSQRRKNCCGFVELDDSWLDAQQLQRFIAPKSKGHLLVEPVISRTFSFVQLSKVWL